MQTIETTARVLPSGIEFVKNSNNPNLLNKVHTLAHREWARRPPHEIYESLDSMEVAADNFLRISASREVKMSGFEAFPFDDEASLGIRTERGVSYPTNWAFSQMCREIGAPAGYLRTLPAPLAAQAFNVTKRQKIEEGADKNFKMYLHRYPDRISLAAATSPKYGRIYNVECVRLMQALVRRNPKFHNPLDWGRKNAGLYLSDRDVFIFLIDGGSMLDVGPRAKFNTGVICINSEVGKATFELWRFFFNVVCGNLMIWNPSNVSKLSIRHTQGGPGRFAQEGWGVMNDLINEPANDLEDSVNTARTLRLESDTPEGWVKIFMPKGFTKTEVMEAHAMAVAEEKSTAYLWDAIQGFTASARELDFADARFDLSERAGKLLENLTRS